MKNELEREPTLAELEEEVVTEGREWMRQRLQEKLRERAEKISSSFSPRATAAGALSKKKADVAQQRRERADRG